MSAFRIAPIACIRGAGLAAVLVALAGSPKAWADGGVDVVTTAGSGELTLCRSYLIYNSCDRHRVVLPPRVAVGDRLKLTYGSNPKDYNFHVRQIRQQGDSCTILNRAGGEDGGVKIDVASCHATAKDP